MTGCRANSLTIYGQSIGGAVGNLVVDAGVHGIQNFSNLTIHGGNITVESKKDGINEAAVTIYGGKLSISAEGLAIDTGSRKNMTGYGGEVNAISKIFIGINVGDVDGTLTVYGGKVSAQGGEGYPAIQGKFKAGVDTGIGFFGCNDNVSWTTITNTPTTATTSEFKYFHAGVEAPTPPIEE